jgi:hypothetical protein
MNREGSPVRPVYKKLRENENTGTSMFMVLVDEGWRTWILCTGMYEHIADDLIQRLTAYPKEWNY